MRLLVAVLSFVLLAACGKSPESASEAKPAAQPSADAILHNAFVYTADSARSTAEALAIRDGRIVFVGSNADVERLQGPETELHDLGGRMVMPALHDMHIHALGTAELDRCDFKGEAMSLERMVPFLQDCIERFKVPEGEWLIVQQWPYARGNQPSDALPTIRAALDAASAKHPIFLLGDDGHHAAANSLAFAAARDAAGNVVGLSGATLATHFSTYRSMIAVDARGEPSGGLSEGARLLIRPHPLADMMGLGVEASEIMPKVAARLAAAGITSIQDPWVMPETLALYDWLQASGQMHFRVRAALFRNAESSHDPGALAQIPAHVAAFRDAQRAHAGNPRVTVDAVKLFVDSVLEGNPRAEPPTLPVAAVLGGLRQPRFEAGAEPGTLEIAGYVDTDGEPCVAYRDNRAQWSTPQAIEKFRTRHGFLPAQCEQNSGELEHGEEYIREYVRQMTEAGFHLHLHALSDRGVRLALDSFAAVKPQADAKGLTQSIAHMQLVHPDDQARFGALGVYPVFTYVWMFPSPEYEMQVVPFIDRVNGAADLYNPAHYYTQNAYPVKAVADGGAALVFGSDAPVGSRDPMPFISMAAALTREADGIVLNAAQRIDIERAIDSYTVNPARLMKHEGELGTLEPGKLADLIVLDRNIVELARGDRAAEIAGTQVLETWFEGKRVYERGP